MYCLVNTKLKICIFNQLKNNTNLEVATLKKSSPHSNETFQNIQYIDLGCLSNFLKYYFSWEQYWVMLYPASQCYSYVCTIYISLPRTHKCNLAFITQLHCDALLRVWTSSKWPQSAGSPSALCPTSGKYLLKETIEYVKA